MKRFTSTFNLTLAQKGATVETNCGYKVRIVSFNAGSEEYPIVAVIENGIDHIYMCDLFNSEGVGAESRIKLVITEYREAFKAFDKVIVRNPGHDWHTDIYSHWDAKWEGHVCGNSHYAECLPYEGNEHLVGTGGKSFDQDNY